MGPEVVGPKLRLSGVRQAGGGGLGVFSFEALRLPRERPVCGETAPRLPEVS